MTDRPPRWIPASDWWIELLLVPLALGTAFWALWHAAFLAQPGSLYGLGAGVLSGLWFLVLAFTDLNRYKNRAALLLIVPLILPIAVAWPAVADAAMRYRGIVEECPVASERTYEVTGKYGSHWEREYTLDCSQGEPEIAFSVPEPVETTEDYDYDYEFDSEFDYGDDGFGDPYDDYDFGDYSDEDDVPDSIEVEYDPKDLIGARADDFATESPSDPAGALYFAGFLALAAIGIRLAAARSRQHGP
ncbi:hypothetical protein [Glycomyces paridis]|uniref:Uncharacterized protein n=1 Tax=Glycomyces paridis TaxID=2126555 RepID=A0A4S8PED4_9ACTN|nr:hypothetical protein [Glycomyces paridis]THV28738.1 hypothetical protein E9998_11595 [Glycomyces paridis]